MTKTTEHLKRACLIGLITIGQQAQEPELVDVGELLFNKCLADPYAYVAVIVLHLASGQQFSVFAKEVVIESAGQGRFSILKGAGQVSIPDPTGEEFAYQITSNASLSTSIFMLAQNSSNVDTTEFDFEKNCPQFPVAHDFIFHETSRALRAEQISVGFGQKKCSRL